MGYTEAWTESEGCLWDQETFPDGPDAETTFNEWLESIEADAKKERVCVEVYILYHNHDYVIGEYEDTCVQYLQDHNPDYTFDFSNEEPDEPEEGDITTSDEKHWYQYGKLILTATYDDGYAEKLKAYMDEQHFWPNVWVCSDHGNWCLINNEVYPKF